MSDSQLIVRRAMVLRLARQVARECVGANENEAKLLSQLDDALRRLNHVTEVGIVAQSFSVVDGDTEEDA